MPEVTDGLINLVYAITDEARLFRWNNGKIEWATPMPHGYGEPEWHELPGKMQVQEFFNFLCPVCLQEVAEIDKQYGYCNNCHAFTNRCIIWACMERPVKIAGNVALCRGHAEEVHLA